MILVCYLSKLVHSNLLGVSQIWSEIGSDCGCSWLFVVRLVAYLGGWWLSIYQGLRWTVQFDALPEWFLTRRLLWCVELDLIHTGPWLWVIELDLRCQHLANHWVLDLLALCQICVSLITNGWADARRPIVVPRLDHVILSWDFFSNDVLDFIHIVVDAVTGVIVDHSWWLLD